MPDNTTQTVDRRAFLRRAAITGAVGAGALGAPAGVATTRAETLSAGHAESLLEAHAGEVLSRLEADGVLADRADLRTDLDNDVAGVAERHEGAALVTTEGHPTELRVVTHVDAGTLTVAARPEEDEAYALLDTDEGRLTYEIGEGWFYHDDDPIEYCDCTGTKCSPYDSVGYYAYCCFEGGTSCDYECHCL